MRFVRKKGSGAGNMLVAAVRDSRAGDAWRRFEEFCRRLGGEVREDKFNMFKNCVVKTDAVGTIGEHAGEFYDFVKRYGSELDKEVSLTFSNPLLGGWDEYVSLTFYPKGGELSMVAQVFGHGVEPGGVSVKDETIEETTETDSPRVWIYGEGTVDQNPATDEFVGVGSARARVPMAKVRDAATLRKLLDKVFEHAQALAERAEEELIVPAEEEEEYY